MNDIEIYKTPDGNTEISVKMKDETVWLSQQQMAELFETSRTNIVEHIKHIYEEGELEENSTCRKFRQVQKEGKRQVSREIPFYNLDLIISLGYRVKSATATSFRKWATNILKQYLIEGYAINQKRLEQEHKKFVALQTMTSSLAQSINSEKLENLDDIKKAVNFLQDFSTGLILLDDFDHGNLDKKGKTESPAQRISEEEFLKVINAMKPAFESDVFAVPKDDGFSGAVNNIYQTFGGKELYPTLEEKAAMLLYSITKDHCFHDGNKRIAASCFLYFMQKNNMLYINGKKRIDDDTLFAITLFIAESKSEDMEMFRQIIISILNRSM
ncbi:MAG: virulence RhuM family protein [Treponema sp.]|nr:virulence RhuM family protein [Treponema sp.]